MPQVQLCMASCISDAVVIKTVLEAAGIGTTLAGLDAADGACINMRPGDGIVVLVSSDDLIRANAVIAMQTKS